eukprot:5707582-Heterocapsa_arctica.AAC.1
MAICSMSFGEVFLRSNSWPSMTQMQGPLSCQPSSDKTAATTATGPLACFPLPLSESPCLSILVTSWSQTLSSPAIASGVKNMRFAHPCTTSAGTTMSGSRTLPGTARMIPARHLLALCALPEIA